MCTVDAVPEKELLALFSNPVSSKNGAGNLVKNCSDHESCSDMVSSLFIKCPMEAAANREMSGISI